MKTMVSKHFSLDEVSCNCGCGQSIVDEVMIDKIEQARVSARIPFQINSWNRCEEYNKKIGGSKNSSHVVGKAVDIHYNSNVDLYNMVGACIKAGIPRILIYPKSRFIHIDTNISKVYPIIKIME